MSNANSQRSKYLNKVFPTNQGYEVKVIEYITGHKITVKFLDEHGVIKTTGITSLLRGTVSNPYSKIKRTVHGYIGAGKYKTRVNDKMTDSALIWYAMMYRCYDPKTQAKRPTYKDVIVCDEWHNFQNFSEWFYKQTDWQKGWHIEKDFINGDQRVYSPDNCCFVPNELNSLVISCNASRGHLPIGVSETKGGRYVAQLKKDSITHSLGAFSTPELAFAAYKKEKEAWVKIVAQRWVGLVNPKVIDYLMNWTVNIDD